MKPVEFAAVIVVGIVGTLLVFITGVALGMEIRTRCPVAPGDSYSAGAINTRHSFDGDRRGNTYPFVLGSGGGSDPTWEVVK